jgi:TfoX/Sxy family transcriptional regulator of competence genes
MSYDPEFAERLELFTAGRTGYATKAMFGGMGYLLHGNMCFGTLYTDLVLRVGEQAAQAPLDEGRASVFDITGRPMKGWIMVPVDDLADKSVLHEWLLLAESFASTLPQKAEKSAQRDPEKVTIRQVRNLGKVSARVLQAIGIATRADLERVGPVPAFIQVREQGGKASLNLLYAMAAGLQDRHWNELSQEEKGELLRELDAWADMQQYIGNDEEQA